MTAQQMSLEISAVSSGTLALVFGTVCYDEIDQRRHAWAAWVRECGRRFASWQEACAAWLSVPRPAAT